MQQSKRKKIYDNDDDLMPPNTEDHLKSEKMTTRANESENKVESENNMKLKK